MSCAATSSAPMAFAPRARRPRNSSQAPVAGALVDCLYLIFCSSTGIYELVPGFFAGLIAAIAVALATKAPSEELNKLFDDAIKYND